MPRDKNRRPRRRPKNQTNEEQENQNENNQHLDYYENANEQPIKQEQDYNEQDFNNSPVYDGSRPSYIDPASFGQVEPEIQHYFKNLEKVIDDKDNVPEDLDIMIESAFSEVSGKEFQLSVDHECSRVLEKISCLAPTYRIIYLLNTLNEKFLTCLTHRFASHVCQTLIILATEILDRECRGIPVVIPEELKEELGALPTAEELFISIAKNLSGRWSELIFNPFATHVLRILLQVFHGSPVEDSNSTNSVVKSKNSKKYMQDKSGGNFIAPKLESNRIVPDSFKKLLIQVADELVINVPEVVLRSTVLHITASPVIQLLIQIQAKQGNLEQVDDYVNTLLQGIPSENDISNQGDKLKNPYVMVIIKDNVGSHLFEKILQVISNSMYNRLYQLYFRNKMLDLSLHSTSNFVIQQLITNVRSVAQLELMIEELISSFERLLKIGRPGVIRSIVDACLKLNSCYKEVLKGIAQAFHTDTLDKQKDFIHVVLRMERYETYKQFQHEKVKYHNQGSVLLQSILKFPEPHNGIVINSLLAQPSDTMLELSKDTTSCHIIETLLESNNINLKVKRRIINLFETKFHLLAMDKFGSRVLDACWNVADIQFREKIALELVENETQIANNFFGKFALRNCKIEQFKYKREDWVKREENTTRKKDMLSDLFDDKDKKQINKKQTKVSTVIQPHIPETLKNVVKSETLNLLSGAKKDVADEDTNLSIVKDGASEIDDLFKGIKTNKSKSDDKNDEDSSDSDEQNKLKNKKKKDKKSKDGIVDVLQALEVISGKNKQKKDKKEKKEKKDKKDKKEKRNIKDILLDSKEVKKDKKKSKKSTEEELKKSRKFAS